LNQEILATFIFENPNRSQESSGGGGIGCLSIPRYLFLSAMRVMSLVTPKVGRMIEVKVPCLGPADNKIATNFKHLWQPVCCLSGCCLMEAEQEPNKSKENLSHPKLKRIAKKF
jgi:hypothetical protein